MILCVFHSEDRAPALCATGDLRRCHYCTGVLVPVPALPAAAAWLANLPRFCSEACASAWGAAHPAFSVLDNVWKTSDSHTVAAERAV